MKHPNLGAPPPDLTAGYPEAAARLMANRTTIGARALEIAIQRDPTIRDRLDEIGLRRLLRDSEIFIDRLARSVASDDPTFMSTFADQVSPLLRRRQVSVDDAARLLEGIRAASAAVLSPAEREPADRAIDAGIAVFRDYRRLAGDARKRNPLLAAIYKGA